MHPFDVKVIAGILVLKSARMAEFINRAIPGLKVPETIVERMKSAANPAAEGVRIASEMAVHCRAICAGVHIMAMGRDEIVPQVVAVLK